MHTDEEIKASAYQQLDKLPESKMEDKAELTIEVQMPDTTGKKWRYAVFFERALREGRTGWIVRNIIRPNDLEDPQPKGNTIE